MVYANIALGSHTLERVMDGAFEFYASAQRDGQARDHWYDLIESAQEWATSPLKPEPSEIGSVKKSLKGAV